MRPKAGAAAISPAPAGPAPAPRCRETSGGWSHASPAMWRLVNSIACVIHGHLHSVSACVGVQGASLTEAMGAPDCACILPHAAHADTRRHTQTCSRGPTDTSHTGPSQEGAGIVQGTSEKLQGLVDHDALPRAQGWATHTRVRRGLGGAGSSCRTSGRSSSCTVRVGAGCGAGMKEA